VEPHRRCGSTPMSYVNDMVRAYFTAAGVDLGGANILQVVVASAEEGRLPGQRPLAASQNAQGKALFFMTAPASCCTGNAAGSHIIEQAIQTPELHS